MADKEVASEGNPSNAERTGGVSEPQVIRVPGIDSDSAVGTPDLKKAAEPVATPEEKGDSSVASSPDRQPQHTEEAILNVVTGDQPTATDLIGFEPYVRAVAEFLANAITRPPLTLSVEGDWGSGKSSFMLQLQNDLRGRGKRTVWFNAWRHEKEEALWASFALEVIRKLAEDRPLFRRWRAHLKLLYRRYNWKNGWLDILRAGSMVVAFLATAIVLGHLLLTKGPEWSPEWIRKGDNFIKILAGLGGFGGYVALILYLLQKTKEFVGNPLAIDLKKYVDSPDYKSNVAFIEKFHADFSKVIGAYAGRETVFVFIDDLDRCEIPKAAELMQAINLMISDSPQLVFIIGMDREKIAAGLAVKNEKILPYLSSTGVKDSRRSGLEYGYNFIEKFIQLPFRVPLPTEMNVEDLVKNLQPGPGGQARAVRNPPVEENSTVKIKVSNDTETITSIVRMAAPSFDNNPRRVKQFINLFRLRTFIADNTGLFAESEDQEKFYTLTLEQLGKFTAIELNWPLLLTDLEVDPKLLRVLHDIAFGSQYYGGNSVWDRWLNQPKLISLLRYGCYDASANSFTEEKRRVYSLEKLNIDKLLRVSPRLPRKYSVELSAVASGGTSLSATLTDKGADYEDVSVGKSEVG
jgi:KAP family P-loop domain